MDVGAVYHQLMDTYVTSDSDADTEAGPSTSTRNVTPASARRFVLNCIIMYVKPSLCLLICCSSSRIRPTDDWRVKCRELLELLWMREDSTPFREPVDLIDHPGNILFAHFILTKCA